MIEWIGMDEEARICGLNAVRSLFRQRSEDVVKVYLTEDRIPALSAELKLCASRHKAYHLVPREELEKISGTVHHEGVCVIAKRKRELSFARLLDGLGENDTSCLVMLEGVENPHNVGAILRVAANFGVRAILVAEESVALSTALYRTAEGGADAVDIVRTNDPIRAISSLQQVGFRVYATSGRGRGSIYEASLAPRALFLFGSEGEGLTKPLLSAADQVLAIPGTGLVESLNVAAASAVVLGEYWRTHTRRPGRARGRRPKGQRTHSKRRT
jgi:TrmH RNA methyltransferase